MSIAELQRYTAVAKYAQWVKTKQRRETWDQTCDRVEGMMLTRYPDLGDEVRHAYSGLRNFEVLGSQRALQFGGVPILRHNARLYNCTGSYADRLRFFQECFYLLLCGCGTGFSVQERHTATLPRFSAQRRAGRLLPAKTFVIPDCIEGWGDSVGVLLSSYFDDPTFPEYHDCHVTFDPSLIREKGAELSFGIGKAPGPGPLMRALGFIRSLLDHLLVLGLEKPRSIDWYDVVMYFADAVVAGGVRRSATICIFDAWDELMMRAKTGDWMSTNPQRGRSNNSAMLLRGRTSFERFSRLFESTREFGEPGIYWADDPDCLPNPCVEIGFWPRLRLEATAQSIRELLKTYQGPVEQDNGTDNSWVVSGWQFCNLSTVNGKTVRDRDDFYARCEKAAAVGTLQAGFTSFPYLGPVSEAIVKRESLIGVSIGGIMHHPELLLDPEVQAEGARRVLAVNERLAPRVGVNPCARGTCVKPDGNSASLLGAFSGIGPGKFSRGFRIVQANRDEAPYQHFFSVNPHACEPSVWSSNGTDDVVRFPVEYEGRMEDDMTAVEMLAAVKSTQIHWVGAGKVQERCTQPWLSNNVSNTVRVRDHEWDDVKCYLFDNQYHFAGVSLLSWSGDRDYPQAPFTSVWDEGEQVSMYGAGAVAEALPLAREGVRLFGDLWKASAAALSLDAGKWGLASLTWILQVLDFAKQHLGGDARRATYCLKDAWNWKLYGEIKASFVPVDYSQMVERESTITLQGEVACAGGVCELVR